MSTIPFTDAIQLKENRRYLAWVLPVVFVMFLFGIFEPNVYYQGTGRIINYNKEFVEPAPFNYELKKGKDQLEEGDDFNFELVLTGETIPDRVYVSSKQGKFLLKRTAKNKFKGTLAQLRETTQFRFEARLDDTDYPSETYVIDVVGKSALGKFQATLNYPKYLGKEPEVIENASNITIPEGTNVSWSVLTKNSKKTDFWINEKKKSFTNKSFRITHRFFNDAEGSVLLLNNESGSIDTTSFLVDVVKDEYPSINVEEVKDSIKDGVRYFSGVVGDDIGLNALNFVYTITSKDGVSRTETMKASSVFGTETPFNFAVDFRRENVQIEDKIEYFFVVYDNDGVNGSKSSRSRSFVYTLPSLDELNDKRDNEQEKIKDDLTNILEKASEFKEDLDRLRKETLNSKQSNWNKENQVNQLQEEHKDLLNELNTLREQMENSIQEKNQLSEIDEELLEQQELINDLLEELMDDELKDLLDQLEDLMKKQDQEALEENLDELEMSSEDMKKQLDRSLEMLKKMQVNEKIDDIENQLKELAKEQDELKSKTENENKVSEENKSKQDEINEKFEDLKDEIRELDSLNNELERPLQLNDNQEDSDNIENDLNDAKESLDKNKGKKAGESQQGASDKMKQMAEKLDMMQQSSNSQQQQEDMDMLRDILESLVYLSFDQEATMDNLARVSNTDPAFQKHSRTQRRIVDDTKIVADSLNELAKRQPMIAKFIDKELNQIKANHNLAIEDIDERRRRELKIHQQYVMTSYNNLALMLNETLQQMQQQMRNSKPGSGSCNKPGGTGMPKPGEGMSSKSMKEMLKKQLKDMQDGQKPGGKKPGDNEGDKPGGKKPGGGMGLGNKQIAKMAAQQSAIRKRLEQLRNELNKDGSGQGNELNPLIKELEEQERSLVNKRLDNNLIKRQKEILTRLLESEKAIEERGLDEKRESKSGKNQNYSNQIQFEEYNKEKLRQIELLRAVDPAYKKYYKDRANEYFNRVF
jgi:hypothetical protein